MSKFILQAHGIDVSGLKGSIFPPIIVYTVDNLISGVRIVDNGLLPVAKEIKYFGKWSTAYLFNF